MGLGDIDRSQVSVATDVGAGRGHDFGIGIPAHGMVQSARAMINDLRFTSGWLHIHASRQPILSGPYTPLATPSLIASRMALLACPALGSRTPLGRPKLATAIVRCTQLNAQAGLVDKPLSP